jgi:hypothetical protein
MKLGEDRSCGFLAVGLAPAFADDAELLDDFGYRADATTIGRCDVIDRVSVQVVCLDGVGIENNFLCHLNPHATEIIVSHGQNIIP